MKKLIILISLMLVGCNDLPPCPPIKDIDYKTGLFSRSLGTVNMDGEKCEIFEQYNKTQCYFVPSSNPRNNMCGGDTVNCYEQILTRITKCPSGFSSNTITYSQDKFHTEQVK